MPRIPLATGVSILFLTPLAAHFGVWVLRAGVVRAVSTDTRSAARVCARKCCDELAASARALSAPTLARALPHRSAEARLSPVGTVLRAHLRPARPARVRRGTLACGCACAGGAQVQKEDALQVLSGDGIAKVRLRKTREVFRGECV